MSGTPPTSAARPADGSADVRPRPLTGPGIARLTEQLAAAATDGEREALVDGFWERAERQGTPLVEEIDGDPDHRAVTFLWRGHRATRQVLLVANRIGDRGRLAGSLLRRVPGTDVWHLGYRLRADHRGSYRMAADVSPGEPPADPAGLQQRLRSLSAFAAPDPLNPRRIASRWNALDSSVFALPRAPAQPWAARRAGIARGTVERHRRTGTAPGGDRDVWVYRPPGEGHGDLPVLVLCDGDMWFGGLRFQDTLDAMIADGAVPPLAVLAPDAVDNPTRWQDLGGRDPYVRFLADELLPWAAGRWPVTTDPARTAVAGQSLGGVTALYAAHTRPERFGHAIAQSPSLWWQPGRPPGVPQEPIAGTPWLVSRFATAERRPVTVRLDVGLHEGPMAGYARTLRDTLDAHGYPVTLTVHNGGHDYACWRGLLADALAAVLGGDRR
ncbi:enterochelin esterase [Streptomyces gamaensis]|uniref:Enterochelin esterase n=1 Tax=Streptomyces gamaensis TaxID=1763542 RepID=A0ABW0Z1N4_9ACTN